MAANAESVKEAITAEGKKLSSYELVVIVTPELADEKLEARLQAINQSVTGRGGVVESADRWGKKKLAYPIKRFTEGTYVLYHLKMPASASQELEANLKITEDVIRHLMVKIEA